MWARRVLAARVRSGRLIDHLTVVRAAAAAHPATADGDSALGQLVADIDALTTHELPTGTGYAGTTVAGTGNPA